MESSGDSIRSLDCLICFTSYNSKERRPRSLTCGHTFCSKCLTDNIQSNKSTCPNCRKSFKANSCHDFPVNFELERSLGDQTYVSTDAEKVLMCPPHKDTSKSISKKLRGFRRDTIEEVDELSKKNLEIISHLEQYDSYLEEGIDQHKAIIHQHEIIIENSLHESNKVKKIILVEKERRKRMEKAKDILVSASTTQEIFQALEDVNICSEDLQRSHRKTVGSFPKQSLLKQAMELRQMSEIIMQRLTACKEQYEMEDEGEEKRKKRKEGEVEEKDTSTEKDDEWKMTTANQASGVNTNQDEGLTSSSTGEEEENKREPGETSDEDDLHEGDERISESLSIQEKMQNVLQKMVTVKTEEFNQTEVMVPPVVETQGRQGRAMCDM